MAKCLKQTRAKCKPRYQAIDASPMPLFDLNVLADLLQVVQESSKRRHAREPRLVACIELTRGRRSVVMHRIDQRAAGGRKPQRHVAVGLGIVLRARRLDRKSV